MSNQQQSHHPHLESGNWQLLSPPGDSNHARHHAAAGSSSTSPSTSPIQIGLIHPHPTLNRLAYTTRTPTDQSHDLGKAQIIIQDYDITLSHECPDANGRVVSCITLRELVGKINDYRATSELSSIVAASAHSRDIQNSLSPISAANAPITVAMLGSVQQLCFLDRAAIKAVVPPPNLVREDPSPLGIYKLMIGFRKCMVIVSLFRLKDQNKEQYARGITVHSLIGPEDWDVGDGRGVPNTSSDKQAKKHPSSFAVPVSEHILAYGSYDGGLRFYDMVGKRQAKSALGPNGRNVPIVRVINANISMESQQINNINNNNSNNSNNISLKSSNKSTKQTMQSRPRIICASSHGIGYLWELDLSIEVTTGEILKFDIPPPLATFDGLSAVLHGVLETNIPPTTLPTTISPSSSFDEIDRFHSQFEPTYDPHRNILVWTFSSECVGALTNTESDGSLVVWDLSTLPPPSWPPPTDRPISLTDLPDASMECRLVIPGIANDVVDNTTTSDSAEYLTSAYISKSGELMAFVVDTFIVRGEPFRGSVSDNLLAEVSKFGNHCYSIAKSRTHPYQIFIGTQHGILLARIAASHNEIDHDLFTIGEDQSVMELESLSHFSLQTEDHTKQRLREKVHDSSNVAGGGGGDGGGADGGSNSSAEVKRLKAKVTKLEMRNMELEDQLKKAEFDMHSMSGDPEQIALKARVAAMLEQQQRYQDMAKREVDTAQSKVEQLENQLSSKMESHDALEADAERMRRELSNVSNMLDKERSLNQSTNIQLRSLMAEVKKLEEDLAAKDAANEALQAENGGLSAKLEDCVYATNGVSGKERNGSFAQSNFTRDSEYSRMRGSDALGDAVRAAEEADLRSYIKLLEEDRNAKDKELEEAKFIADENSKSIEQLQRDAREQKLSIESLVDLLEREKKNHDIELSSKNQEISSLRTQLDEVQAKFDDEVINTDRVILQCRAGNDEIASQREEIERLRDDLSQSNSRYEALKTELQSALNDLAEYRREQNGFS